MYFTSDSRPATLALVLVLASGLAGCSSSRWTNEMAIGENVASLCPPRSNAAYFFPPRTFASAQYDGAPSRKELSNFFALMAEPSLSCGETPDEAYRVLNYFPFWGPPHPVAIRITRSGLRTHLVAVPLTGGRNTAADLSPGHRIDRELTDTEWKTFIGAVDRADFWIAPPNPPPSQVAILDGDAWVIEGRRGRLYRTLPLGALVDRPAIVALSKAFFTMAGLPIPG